MTETINNVHDIRTAVERAIHFHAPLRAEFDAGWTTIEPNELREAWDDYSLSDPFTLDPTMPNLLARIDADHPDADPQVWVPLGGQGDPDYLDAVVVTERSVTKYTAHDGQIEQRYALPEGDPHGLTQRGWQQAASAARYAIIGLNADASNTEYLRGQIEAYLTAFGHFEPGHDADAKRERVTAEITAAIAAQ
ncbi:MAG: hypothetical protein DI573_13420 [Microbacterium sp.]|jgi:hypothetical protein|uniref:hypothetical protein n=1 Tax=Microbacterium sp. TaxID=51671 RepID=UPI000DB355E0|nr:hypothetical protein [Microbacterium sp.]PZU36549.1 MAG: hypothetical protein DI573_13420 [Microbacterium sp.]